MLNNIGPKIPNEEWLPVLGFEEFYLCSNFGRVFGKRRAKLMKLSNHNQGYKTIRLKGVPGVPAKNFLVHRIVALAFIPNPLGSPIINHLDADKSNNSASNLEWVTNSENIMHARNNGRNPYNYPTLGRKLGGKKKSASAYHGVFRDRNRGVWVGALSLRSKLVGQKRFSSEINAAKHYNMLVRQHDLKRPLNDV